MEYPSLLVLLVAAFSLGADAKPCASVPVSGTPNRPAEAFPQPPAAQPDPRFAPPTSRAGAAPGPNSPSIPRPSYSEPGAAPESTPNTNNPAQGYPGPRNSGAQSTPSEGAARQEFARSSAEQSEKPAGPAPAQGRITIHNSRAGEELILDDTNPAAPIRTLRTGLPRPLADQVEKRPQ